MTTKRLKVLLGCYACDPNYGSEPGMGWNFVSNIAKYHDVHAIVEEGEFKESLTRFAAENPDKVKNITFHFVPRTHHETLRKIWPPSYYWFYRAWHRRAYKLAVELDKKENFDIVHQVTLAGFREPGFLWKLKKPFIWGPLGGFTQTSWSLILGMNFHSILFFSIQNIINFFQKRYSLSVRNAARQAHTILVSDQQGMNDVQQIWHRRPTQMLEVGVDLSKPLFSTSSRKPNSPLRICWAGELIPRKSLDILIQAITHCKQQIHVDVLGRGPMMTKWKAQVTQLQLDNNFTFHGFIPHEQVMNIMTDCHAMCITSIKEGGTSTIVLEALQSGLPIVALNLCGFATVINESAGIKIPIQSRRKTILNLAEKLDFLAENETIRLELAEGARKHAARFSWEAKIEKLNEIYQQAMSKR